MELISQKNLDLIACEDIDTLIQFDDKGLLLGSDESLEHYIKRLTNLKDNIVSLNQDLEEKGQVELIGTSLTKDDVIPYQVFESAQSTTQDLYGFDIDWVPGFYTNSKMGLLFAGCAMYSYDDFFAVFIIRKAFQFKERWIIYGRTELMAHELCHVAHIGFHTKNYEEIFAYQTSESLFRKLVGGMLRTTTDTYLLMASMIGLLAAQIINIAMRPPSAWRQFPMSLIYATAFLVFCYVFFRYLLYWHRFKSARTNLARVFGDTKALSVLFRCDGGEIKELSRLKQPSNLRTWISRKLNASIRWRIIVKKFSPW